MARHPEVSEKSIIRAGVELEKLGKTPNPGAIRAHLGYRGGLLRIKSIWESFLKQREQAFLQEQPSEITLDALPEVYSSNASTLIEKVSNAIEQLTIEAYVHSQQLFEKRLKILEQSHIDKLEQYIASEKSADVSIARLETEQEDLQDELEKLASQNAKLLIENSEFRGRLAVFDEKFNPDSNQKSPKV